MVPFSLLIFLLFLLPLGALSTTTPTTSLRSLHCQENLVLNLSSPASPDVFNLTGSTTGMCEYSIQTEVTNEFLAFEGDFADVKCSIRALLYYVDNNGTKHEIAINVDNSDCFSAANAEGTGMIIRIVCRHAEAHKPWTARIGKADDIMRCRQHFLHRCPFPFVQTKRTGLLELNSNLFARGCRLRLSTEDPRDLLKLDRIWDEGKVPSTDLFIAMDKNEDQLFAITNGTVKTLVGGDKEMDFPSAADSVLPASTVVMSLVPKDALSNVTVTITSSKTGCHCPVAVFRIDDASTTIEFASSNLHREGFDAFVCYSLECTSKVIMSEDLDGKYAFKLATRDPLSIGELRSDFTDDDRELLRIMDDAGRGICSKDEANSAVIHGTRWIELTFSPSNFESMTARRMLSLVPWTRSPECECPKFGYRENTIEAKVDIPYHCPQMDCFLTLPRFLSPTFVDFKFGEVCGAEDSQNAYVVTLVSTSLTEPIDKAMSGKGSVEVQTVDADHVNSTIWIRHNVSVSDNNTFSGRISINITELNRHIIEDWMGAPESTTSDSPSTSTPIPSTTESSSKVPSPAHNNMKTAEVHPGSVLSFLWKIIVCLGLVAAGIVLVWKKSAIWRSSAASRFGTVIGYSRMNDDIEIRDMERTVDA